MADVPALPYDILPPPLPAPLPPDYTWYIVGGSVIVVALAAAVLRHAWRSRHRRRARAALRRAEAAFRVGQLPARDAAFAIAAAMMQGFETRQLRAAPDSEAAWADFVARLDTLRYATRTAEVGPLFAQARHWLKRGPRPC
jgi:hypothetical protein